MVPTLATDVAGLDEILGGGIPLRSMILILGKPGAGKTILAEQIAVAQAKAGQARPHSHRALGIARATARVAPPVLVFREALVGDRIRFLSIQTLLRDGLEATADAIVEIVRAEDASLVVLDGFRGVAGFANSDREVRLFLYEVRTRLALLEVTTLVTLEATSDAESDSSALTVADGIIRMHNTLWGVRHRRHLEVQKLRAMNPLNGLHTITITGDGITCYPRHEAVYRTANYAVGTDRASLGLPELDEMLHGGLNRGTVTFLAGSSRRGEDAHRPPLHHGGCDGG